MKGKILITNSVLFAVFISMGCAGKTGEIQSRRQQAMAMVLARQLCQCQEMHRLDYAAYTDDFSKLDCWEDFSGDYGGLPYTIYLTPESYLDLSGVHYELPAGIEPFTDDWNFSAALVGNIDGDPAPDVWFVDDYGEPVNKMNDFAN